MKTAVYILSILMLVIVSVVAVLRLLPAFAVDNNTNGRVSFGVYEGRELVELVDRKGNTCYIVEDGNGNKLFNVPVRDCMIDVRFRDGRLRFREKATGRTGFVDRNGIVTFNQEGRTAGYEQAKYEQAKFQPQVTGVVHEKRSNKPGAAQSGRLDDVALRRLKSDNPFYREAVRVLSGKLGENDAERRRVILNYCEHFRMAYVTKDIDFIRQLFSGHALIIVGNVVKSVPDEGKEFASGKRVEYYLRTKDEYIKRLTAAFAANKKIDVRFSDFRIMRHPTIDGIYGVSLRQRYSSDRYSDDGWLFLLWDFRDESMPCIYVRTWQPADDVHDGGDVISIGDFNME